MPIVSAHFRGFNGRSYLSKISLSPSRPMARAHQSMIFKRAHLKASSIATGWTGVDMSTPLLLEVAPEIDTNPTSFYRGRGGWSLRLQTPVIGSRSALAMSVHPTYFDLATPLLKALSIICVLASLTGLTKFCRCKLVYSFVRVRLTIENPTR